MAPVSQPCSKKTKNANINSKNKQHENIKKKKKKNVFFKSAPKPTEETEKPAEAGKLQTNPMKTTAKLPGNREEASSNWKNLYSAIKPNEATTKYALIRKKKKENSKAYLDGTGKYNASKDGDEPEVWFDNVDPILLDTQTDVPSSETQLHIAGGHEGYTHIFFIY